MAYQSVRYDDGYVND